MVKLITFLCKIRPANIAYKQGISCKYTIIFTFFIFQ